MPKGQPPVHKVIISGTGRCGTTFLVQLLTELGLDTGISSRNWNRKYYPHSHAGLEHELLDPETPYIIKNPALCDTLAGALSTGRFIIDHAYVPIRELAVAAASRADIGGGHGSRAGGLWGTSDADQQKAVLAEMFHNLLHTLAEHDIPHTLILFPRMVNDPAYTYRKLTYLLRGISRETFQAAFEVVANPSLVHSFGPGAEKVERPPIPQPKPRLLTRLFSSAGNRQAAALPSKQ